MAKSYDYLFKILLIGDSGVGKSQILERLTGDFGKETVTVDMDGKKIKLYIQNKGDPNFPGYTSFYYRGAMGIMLVYDITNEKSFDRIGYYYMKDIKEGADANIEIMILGNKWDLSDSRVVSKERGQSLADKYGIKFMETSAKASINVEEALLTLAKDIKAKMKKPDDQKQSRSNGGHVQQVKTRGNQDKGKCMLS